MKTIVRTTARVLIALFVLVSGVAGGTIAREQATGRTCTVQSCQ